MYCGASFKSSLRGPQPKSLCYQRVALIHISIEGVEIFRVAVALY